MEQSQIDHLQKIWLKLLDNIADVDGVIDGLFSLGVLTRSLKEQIVEGNPVTSSRLRALMDVLPRRGKEAYRHFYDVLVDRDEKVAAELVGQKLQEQPEEEQQVPDSWAVFHTLPAVDDELPERWPDDATHDPKRVEVVKVHPEDIEMTTRFERASTGKSPPVRGRFLLINNEKYEGGGFHMGKRVGSQIDLIALDLLFRQLGFYVVIKTDLTASEMLAAFREQAAFDHSQYDCFACALLSHGDVDDTLFGTDGQSVKLDQLQDALDGKNCPTLNGKPKLFFVGSGRGGELDEGVERDIETPASSDDGNPTESVQADRKEKATGEESREMQGKQVAGTKEKTVTSVTKRFHGISVKDFTYLAPQRRAPRKADFFTAYATPPGKFTRFFAWRNATRGSWFIQAVVCVFSRLAHRYDIMSLMTRVNRLVSTAESTTSASFLTGKKQMPVFTSSLTREFYFFPGLQHGDVGSDTQATVNTSTSTQEQTS
ncbi:hypothetical protein BaRGS_00025291 [Batillaria attramentaria]|uniref:Uncharacterized protein n=1 Tax=Batillaria attramentaria TaxID=370345 RepID=A0ABD0K8S6_9CAEN